MQPRFGPEFLEELIGQIRQAGYSLLRLDEPQPNGLALYLRWDVDISPDGAFLVGDLLHRLGVQASFFFQLNAETYQVFSRPTLEGMTRLRSQGHAVGLHLDENLVGTDPQKIQATVDWFQHCCCPIDRVVSFHRPTPAALGLELPGLVNAYGSRHFDPASYLSDSRRSLEFVPRLQALLGEKRSPLQLLLHPEWWEPLEDARAVWDQLCRRRQQELEAYCLKAFAKVFTPIIKNTQPRF